MCDDSEKNRDEYEENEILLRVIREEDEYSPGHFEEQDLSELVGYDDDESSDFVVDSETREVREVRRESDGNETQERTPPTANDPEENASTISGVLNEVVQNPRWRAEGGRRTRRTINYGDMENRYDELF